MSAIAKKYKNVKRNIAVRRSKAGLGLSTEKPIEKDGFVLEYKGPILTREQAEKKGGRYLFDINSRRTIDGSSRKNFARYINHSCKPNSVVEVEKKRIFIYSKRAIKPGEEIAYHYGKEYFDDVIKPLGCKCSFHA